MGYAIGVDVGGSAIKLAVVDATGRVVWPPHGKAERIVYQVMSADVGRLVWQSSGATQDVACQTDLSVTHPDGKVIVPIKLVQSALEAGLQPVTAAFGDTIAGLGIGATGLISPAGIVNEGYAFAGYRGFDWVAAAARAGYPLAHVLNDARAGSWAEFALQPDLQGTHLHITAGTRVGCGIILDKQFLVGADSCAGEFSYYQLISPDGVRYLPGARLAGGLLEDPKAFGAALVGVMHVANPNRLVLAGFADQWVAAVQHHLERYAFAVPFRPIMAEATPSGMDLQRAATAAVTRYHEDPGSLVYIAKVEQELASFLCLDGHILNPRPDFLAQMVVCAPGAIAEPGDLRYLEVGGGFGVEAEYHRRTGAALGFEQVCALALAGEPAASGCLELAGQIAAAGIANTWRLVQPQQVTIGGAMPWLYPPYLEIVRRWVASDLQDAPQLPEIRLGIAGNDAGVIGAALYALAQQHATVNRQSLPDVRLPPQSGCQR